MPTMSTSTELSWLKLHCRKIGKLYFKAAQEFDELIESKKRCNTSIDSVSEPSSKRLKINGTHFDSFKILTTISTDCLYLKECCVAINQDLRLSDIRINGKKQGKTSTLHCYPWNSTTLKFKENRVKPCSVNLETLSTIHSSSLAANKVLVNGTLFHLVQKDEKSYWVLKDCHVKIKRLLENKLDMSNIGISRGNLNKIKNKTHRTQNSTNCDNMSGKENKLQKIIGNEAVPKIILKRCNFNKFKYYPQTKNKSNCVDMTVKESNSQKIEVLQPLRSFRVRVLQSYLIPVKVSLQKCDVEVSNTVETLPNAIKDCKKTTTRISKLPCSSTGSNENSLLASSDLRKERVFPLALNIDEKLIPVQKNKFRKLNNMVNSVSSSGTLLKNQNLQMNSKDETIHHNVFKYEQIKAKTFSTTKTDLKKQTRSQGSKRNIVSSTFTNKLNTRSVVSLRVKRNKSDQECLLVPMNGVSKLKSKPAPNATHVSKNFVKNDKEPVHITTQEKTKDKIVSQSVKKDSKKEKDSHGYKKNKSKDFVSFNSGTKCSPFSHQAVAQNPEKQKRRHSNIEKSTQKLAKEPNSSLVYNSSTKDNSSASNISVLSDESQSCSVQIEVPTVKQLQISMVPLIVKIQKLNVLEVLPQSATDCGSSKTKSGIITCGVNRIFSKVEFQKHLISEKCNLSNFSTCINNDLTSEDNSPLRLSDCLNLNPCSPEFSKLMISTSVSDKAKSPNFAGTSISDNINLNDNIFDTQCGQEKSQFRINENTKKNLYDKYHKISQAHSQSTISQIDISSFMNHDCGFEHDINPNVTSKTLNSYDSNNQNICSKEIIGCETPETHKRKDQFLRSEFEPYNESYESSYSLEEGDLVNENFYPELGPHELICSEDESMNKTDFLAYKNFTNLNELVDSSNPLTNSNSDIFVSGSEMRNMVVLETVPMYNPNNDQCHKSLLKSSALPIVKINNPSNLSTSYKQQTENQSSDKNQALIQAWLQWTELNKHKLTF